MAEVKGFCGWRYNKNKIKDLSRVVAPPYDVISKKEQEALHKKNPANVIRLILGKENAKDTAHDNKYTRAGKSLREWMGSGVLVRDEVPTVYVYVQDYLEEGRHKTRIGFIAAMGLDGSSVLKHENTLASPKKDRMSLLKEVKTNLSPIFGLYEDKKAGTRKLLTGALKTKPVLDVKIDGVRHRIFTEQDPARLKKLFLEMKKKPVFIADGHHRFEVASQFKEWMRSQLPKERAAGWNYVMMYFADCTHNPFKIFPTHRLLRFPKGMSSPYAELSKRGVLTAAKDLKAVLKKLEENREDLKKETYDFGFYTKKDGFFLLTLNKNIQSKVGKNPANRLDVAVLHNFIISPGFKIDKIEKSEAIDFTRDAQVAVQKVNAGEFDAAIFLRPTSLKEMIEVSKKGLKMPQKSTYFYPKLLSGLVFHHFETSDGRI